MRLFHPWAVNTSRSLKGGPEPSKFEDLCLVNVSVKYFSKLCFGTIKIQPELKYLKTILEYFTSWFQRAKAWEHEFGRVPSISFICTGSKMARICRGIYYKYFRIVYNVNLDRAPFVCMRSWVHSRAGLLCHRHYFEFLYAFYRAKPIMLEKALNKNWQI